MGQDIELDRRPLLVLDDHGGWPPLAAGSRRVVTVAPQVLAHEELLRLGPSLIVVNVTSSPALRAAHRLRTAGVTVRCRGCLVPPGAANGLALGIIEPVPPGAGVRAAIRTVLATRPRPRVRRVLVLGAHTDPLVEIWSTLTQAGISVAIGPDSNHAIDLLDLVQPDAVVMDLAHPPRGRACVLSHMAAASDIPPLVLLGEPPAGRQLPTQRPCGDGLAPRADILRRLIEAEDAAGAATAAGRPASDLPSLAGG